MVFKDLHNHLKSLFIKLDVLSETLRFAEWSPATLVDNDKDMFFSCSFWFELFFNLNPLLVPKTNRWWNDGLSYYCPKQYASYLYLCTSVLSCVTCPSSALGSVISLTFLSDFSSIRIVIFIHLTPRNMLSVACLQQWQRNKVAGNCLSHFRSLKWRPPF